VSPAATIARIATPWIARMAAAVPVPSTRVRRATLWAASTPDAADHPVLGFCVVKFRLCRPVPHPTPTRHVAGPRAALQRAERLIPDVWTRLIPGAGDILTLDGPGAVVRGAAGRL